MTDFIAALPDPREPGFVVLVGGLGALAGATIGRLRGVGHERTRRIAENWAWAMALLAAVVYVTLLIVGVA